MNYSKIILLSFILIGCGKENGDINVNKYGATGEMSQLVTTIIQKAIDDCSERGGGKVVFPPGDYLSGTVVLKDNVFLYLEPGATLWASRDTADYNVPFKIYKKDIDNQPVLVYAEKASNIGIEGHGTIHGQATRTYEDLKQVDGFIREETELARASGVDMKQYYKVPPFTCMIYLVECTDVTIRDVNLMESTEWTLHTQWCERVNMNGVYIFSSLEEGVNADGLDIDGCRNVTISDCIIETGDDAIVLKTTLTNNRSEKCENVTVNNCVLVSTSTALKLGTESHSDFRHIIFSDCVIRNTNRGLSIVVRDGAHVSDVHFSNITVECNRKPFFWWGNGDPIWLVVKKRHPDSKIGNISNVSFRNITATGQGTSKLEGYPGHPLRNIRMSNVRIKIEPEQTPDKRCIYGFEAHDIVDLYIENLKLEWDETNPQDTWKKAFNFYNVDGLELKDVVGEDVSGMQS